MDKVAIVSDEMMDRENKRAAIEHLKEFRNGFAGKLLLSRIEQMKQALIQECINACNHTGENAEAIRLHGAKASAQIKLIEETFEHESFGLKL